MKSAQQKYNIAVILAGGSGERFNSESPKQFVKLAGKQVIEHTISKFQDHSQIDQIIVVTRQDYVDHIWHIADQNHFSKITKVVSGGTNRFESTLSAIASLTTADKQSKILIHDAVRPFVSSQIINDCLDALNEFSAVDVVIPSADTLVQISDDGCIQNIPPRAQMKRGQTPQAFRLETLQSAFSKAVRKNSASFTCDCGVVRAMLPSTKVATVAGSEDNIKITHPIDLYMAEKLIQTLAADQLENSGNLNKLAGKRILIFGGSSGIGKSIHDVAISHGARVSIGSRRFNELDVAKPDSINNFLSNPELKSSPIDIVINTAGVLIKKPLNLMSALEIQEQVATNYMGCVNIANAVYEKLKESQGTLINFTSSSYTRGRANYAIYSSTKCAIVNFSQAISEEWQASGVRVNCIAPERTKTPMRSSNFGIESDATLLDPRTVAERTLLAATSDFTGLIIDVSLNH